jgi:hypothetical protein
VGELCINFNERLFKKVCEREMVEPKKRVRERVISKRERERERDV